MLQSNRIAILALIERFKWWKLHDIESIEFQNKMLFAKQIQTRDIHKLLVITRASDCVLPLIHIYASKWLRSSSFDSNFSRRRVCLLTEFMCRNRRKSSINFDCNLSSRLEHGRMQNLMLIQYFLVKRVRQCRISRLEHGRMQNLMLIQYFLVKRVRQ
jgi:hypothetical protein